MNGKGDGDRIGILLLQESHLTEDEATVIQNNHKRLRIFTSPTPDRETSAGGVTFVVNTELVATSDATFKTIIPGRAATLTVPWYGTTTLTVMNVYAPATTDQEKAAFYKELVSKFETDTSLHRPTYLAGDFNMVEAGIDRSSGRDDAKTVVDALWDLKVILGVQDAFRLLHPDARELTWRSLADPQRTWARLDRGYIQTTLAPYVHSARVQTNGVRSDHRMFTIEVEGRDAPFIGKGRWSMPTDLLKNPKMLAEIETLGMQAIRELPKPEDRTDERNAQLILSNFKAQVKTRLREYDKIMKPNSKKRTKS
ncbi:DNase I-like protein [Peniophora sp. CONT]|nr:DNase I-like protein [Peniophora sp. CONT]